MPTELTRFQRLRALAGAILLSLCGAASAAPPFTVSISNGSSTTCGAGCIVVQVGRSGSDYWTSTGIDEETASFTVSQPSRITSVVLRDAHYDDWLQVRINNATVWANPPQWTGDPFCDGFWACVGINGGNHNSTINLDVTNYFNAGGQVVVKTRTQHDNRGESQAYLVLRFTSYQCSDDIDNDGDGKIDYPADDGCESVDEDNEQIDPGPPGTPCPGCICNADINGDGATDAESEFGDCSTYSGGSVCPLQRKMCTVAAGKRRCPGSPSSPCVDDGTGNFYCSPNQCFLRGTTVEDVHEVDLPEPQDNGPRDSSGQCLGVLKVFAGQGKRCRKSGTQTAFQNCCSNKNGKLNDTMGEKGGKDQLDYKEEKTAFEFWANQCDIQDQQTSLLADSNYCIYLGEYCAEKWISGCVQKAKSYCCFNSLLAKMLQEQGRAQLPEMGGFGSAKNPRCDGFTIEQFQALDFSKMNLDSYNSSFKFASPDTMKTQMQGNVKDNTGR